VALDEAESLLSVYGGADGTLHTFAYEM